MVASFSRLSVTTLRCEESCLPPSLRRLEQQHPGCRLVSSGSRMRRPRAGRQCPKPLIQNQPPGPFRTCRPDDGPSLPCFGGSHGCRLLSPTWARLRQRRELRPTCSAGQYASPPLLRLPLFFGLLEL